MLWNGCRSDSGVIMVIMVVCVTSSKGYDRSCIDEDFGVMGFK